MYVVHIYTQLVNYLNKYEDMKTTTTSNIILTFCFAAMHVSGESNSGSSICSLGSWGEWSLCSSRGECEKGVRTRTRQSCNLPQECEALKKCWECETCEWTVSDYEQTEFCTNNNLTKEGNATRVLCKEKHQIGYWLESHNNWYLLVNAPMNWTQAYTYCHFLNLTLMTPRNRTENYWITAKLAQIAELDPRFWDGSVDLGYWIGANDFLHERYFVHDDFFTPVNYTNFADGEPNEPEFGNEDCIEIYIPGLWNDFSCFLNLPFICQRSCNCHPSGVEVGSACDRATGECLCRPGGDQKYVTGSCSPYITAIHPSYGPDAGGTLITIYGGYLNYSEVTIGEEECIILTRSDTKILCISPPNNNSGTHNISLVQNNGAATVYDNNTFIYKGNPKIERIYPLQTFVQGGINISVFGENLDSISQPIMQTRMVYDSDETIYHTICVSTSSNEMKCPTPEIKLPYKLSKRRKRRLKIRHEFNDEDLQFYIGFILDGLPTYRNLSESLPSYSVLKVYPDPIIHPFEEDNKLQVFQPLQRPFIDIMGKRLNYGCRSEDYRVTIGKSGICNVTSLTSNQVTCRPPMTQPEAHEDDYGHLETPKVVVFVGNIIATVGYLQWEVMLEPATDPWWENAVFIYVISTLTGIILLVIIVTAVAVIKWREEKKLLEIGGACPPTLNREWASRNDYDKPFASAGNDHNVNSPICGENILSLLDEELKLKVDQCCLDPDRLSLGPVVGKGYFGKVHQGSLRDKANENPVKVAIKALKGEINVSTEDLRSFLEEATLMNNLIHENVLTLCGIVLKQNKPYVVLPYMENGDLKTFIANPYNIFTVRELLGFGLQIARGMEYLSSQKYIHRDLAARNCMIDKDLTVKIADFGLSRDVYEKDYYCVSDEKRPLPIKWMALESLQLGVFTTKSDVWSFAVVLWELLTRGCAPYADVANFEMKQYLNEGHRLTRPEYSPIKVFNMMTECWDANAENRPQFTSILDRLTKIVNSPSQKKLQELPVIKLEDYLQPITMDFDIDK